MHSTSTDIRRKTIRAKSSPFFRCCRIGCAMLTALWILWSTISCQVSDCRCYQSTIANNPLMHLYSNNAGKFRREFKNVLERGHCLTHRTNQRNHHWQSQYRSRYGNDDQEHSFIHSTTHMMNVTPSLRRNFGCTMVSILSYSYFRKICLMPTAMSSQEEQSCQSQEQVSCMHRYLVTLWARSSLTWTLDNIQHKLHVTSSREK